MITEREDTLLNYFSRSETGTMKSDDSEMIESLSSYIRKLNDEEDALVVVEGKRDAQALRDSGYMGEVFMLCHNMNVVRLEDAAIKFKKTILLLDNDQEGSKLTARTERVLRGRVRMDLFYRRELLPASKGKIRHIEELAPYSERVSRHVSLR